MKIPEKDMSLHKLVAEVAELCGHEDYASRPVDLASLGVSVKQCHTAVVEYFSACVPTKHIDRPFYQLLSVAGVAKQNTEFLPSRYILPFGFVTFANVPNGDAIAADVADGSVYIVSHEIFSDRGVRDASIKAYVPITRVSILKCSKNSFDSIRNFFQKWRDQMIEWHREEDQFFEAAAKNPNATDEFGDTLLIRSIREGDLKMVKSEVKRGADLEHFNGSGRTPLGEAVTFRQPRIVECLIKQGANVNAKSDTGTTPLMVAAQYAQLECMKKLLKAGADRTATDAEGKTALDQLCVVHGTPAMKKLLYPTKET